MTEVTQIRLDGKSRLADDVVAYLRTVGREDLIPAETVLDDRAADDVLVDFHADEMRRRDAEPKRRRLPSGKAVTAAAFGVLLVGIQGVVQAESWRGLAGFGRLIHIAGTATQGVPLTLDGVSTIAALLALKAELSDESSGRERAAMYAFTAMSCAANYWHGSVTGGIEGALYFAAMSLAVMFVFDLVLRQIRLAVRRSAGRRNRKRPQFGLVHWARYPRLTFRAWSLALALGIEDPQEALAAARVEVEAAAVAAMDLPVLPIDAATLAGMSAASRLAVAFGALGKTDVPAALALLRQHGAPIDSSHAYKVRSQILEGGVS
jgi:hypothetical protein